MNNEDVHLYSAMNMYIYIVRGNFGGRGGALRGNFVGRALLHNLAREETQEEEEGMSDISDLKIFE